MFTKAFVALVLLAVVTAAVPATVVLDALSNVTLDEREMSGLRGASGSDTCSKWVPCQNCLHDLGYDTSHFCTAINRFIECLFSPGDSCGCVKYEIDCGSSYLCFDPDCNYCIFFGTCEGCSLAARGTDPCSF